METAKTSPAVLAAVFGGFIGLLMMVFIIAMICVACEQPKYHYDF